MVLMVLDLNYWVDDSTRVAENSRPYYWLTIGSHNEDLDL